MGAAATTDENAGAAAPPERRQVEDGTAYWTLSFYISRAQIEDLPLAMRLDPTDFKKPDNVKERDALIENFSIARYFTDHPLWRKDEEPPEGKDRRTLDDLRMIDPFDAKGRVRETADNLPRADETKRLQGAINPLFNDIADRSRLGRIEDQLFAAGSENDLNFVLPERINWSTEGQTFEVQTDRTQRAFPIHVTRFWYLHGNGSMSWHVSFDVNYRNDKFEAALEQKRVPHALYLLSLMQKLAYPKEKEVDPADVTKENDEATSPPRSDKLFGLRIVQGEAAFSDADNDPTLFWNRIKSWFARDKDTLAELYKGKAKQWEPDWFPYLCPHMAINEIPGLFCVDSRSNFFIQDKQFFDLIQPKSAEEGKEGELVERRTHILDRAFENYPGLIECYGKKEPHPKNPKQSIVTLGEDYWREMLTDGAGTKPEKEGEPAKEIDDPGPQKRLLYLFLAGFNQNIIDWTNQEASEVLDSLDPIYPKSDEQLEEGFFIRYANPRCLITYVQRSRTLEVGNDFIGTCPYAFLIHVLAMHNERLTRDQEKLAFAVVEKVNSYVREAQAALSKLGSEEEPRGQAAAAILRRVGKTVQEAEAWINWYRMAAFEHFDRHRYVNPFRYDTERDVFDELETLRGTSRLEKALEKAFGALDESTRDLERVRAEAEREQERQDDRARSAEKELADTQEQQQDRLLALLFGLIGISGVGQLIFNWYDYLVPEDRQPTWLTETVIFWSEIAVAVLLLGGVVAVVWMYVRLRQSRRS